MVLIMVSLGILEKSVPLGSGIKESLAFQDIVVRIPIIDQGLVSIKIPVHHV